MQSINDSNQPPARSQVTQSAHRALAQWSLLLGIGCSVYISPLGNLLKAAAVEHWRIAQPTEDIAQSTLLTVETQSIESVDTYSVTRPYHGTVSAQRSVDLGFEQLGILSSVAVQVGEFVEAGEPLASLDSEALKLESDRLVAQREQAIAQLRELQNGALPEEIAAAQAAVAAQQAQVSLSEQQLQRRESLFLEGAVSREQLDTVAQETEAKTALLSQAQSQLNQLANGTRIEQIEAQRAQVKQFDTRIKLAEVNLQKRTLLAPFSGTITEILLEEGAAFSTLTAGTPVLRLVEDSQLEARIGLPLGAAQSVSVGQKVQLQANGSAYPATVVSVLPQLETSSQTQTIILHPDPSRTNPPVPGQLVEWNLTDTALTNGYWLPATALVRTENGLWSCFVAKPIGTDRGQASVYMVERREVNPLTYESDRVLVAGALADGENVILSGTHRVVPGQKVVVRP